MPGYLPDVVNGEVAAIKKITDSLDRVAIGRPSGVACSRKAGYAEFQTLHWGTAAAASLECQEATCMDASALNSSMGLTEVQIAEILDRIEEEADGEYSPTSVPAASGNDPWIDFRGKNVRMTVEHPGGGVSQSFVYTSRLRRNAISLIHRGFLHAESSCRIEIVISGIRKSVDGHVRSCCHLKGLAHLVVIAFDVQVELP